MNSQELIQLRKRLLQRDSFFQSLVDRIPTTGYIQEGDLSGDEILNDDPPKRKPPETKKKRQKKKKDPPPPVSAPSTSKAEDADSEGESDEEDTNNGENKMEISVSEIMNDPVSSLKSKEKKQKGNLTKTTKNEQSMLPDDSKGAKTNISDIERNGQKLEDKSSLSLKNKVGRTSGGDSSSSSSSDEESDGGDVGGGVGAKQKLPHPSNTKQTGPKVKKEKIESLHILPRTVQADAEVEDLHEAVRQKIEDMKLKRKAKEGGDGEVSKKKLKAMEKKKRKKAKIAAVKAKKEKGKTVLNGSIGGENNGEAVNLGKAAGTKEEKADTSEEESGQMMFSKFDFKSIEVDPGVGGKKRKRNKKGAVEGQTGKHFEHLLEKVKQKKEKYTQLKETNPEAATDWMSDQTWRKALLKSEGVKIKDDPELLKKSLRNRQKRKDKSKKKWKEREETTQKLIKDKQMKRFKNIKEKQNERKNKKVKRLQKKGKLLLKDTD